MKKLLLVLLFSFGFTGSIVLTVRAVTADKWWLAFIGLSLALYFVLDSVPLLYYLEILKVPDGMCRWCKREHNFIFKFKGVKNNAGI